MDAAPPTLPLYLWPTPGQAKLLQAALCPDAEMVDAYRAWRQAVDIDAQFDWGTFRLLPLVYDRLRALGAEDALMMRLKGVYRMAWVETQALFNDAAPVVAALEAAGIDTMMLKGAPLALGYYRTPAARPMRDVDIVVPRDAGERAIAVVKALGWTPAPDVALDEMAYIHSITFRSPAGREIDLHWHCLYEAMSGDADAWFWEGARPFNFCGVATRQPAPEPLLAHVVLHGLRANPEPPIRWIADAMAILRTTGEAFDWDGFVAYARAHELSYRLSLGLDYLVRHHAAAVPASALSALAASGRSLAERIENALFLDAGVRRGSWFGERWANVADYGRFFRSRPAIHALWGGLDYMRVGWKLQRRRQLPAEALKRTGRMLRRVFA